MKSRRLEFLWNKLQHTIKYTDPHKISIILFLQHIM